MKAIWNDKVIAQSNETFLVEGNHYFPPSSIKQEFFKASATSSLCLWKGTASYYTLTDGDKETADAAWCYKEPSYVAHRIKDYVAFSSEVLITENE